MRNICRASLTRPLQSIAVIALGVLGRAPLAPAADHVVVVVFDGFRPDSITEADTPTVYKMAHEGTFFAHHHPVYPSSTEVNGTALSTGGYPVHNGIMANTEYRPDIELLKPVGTQEESAVRKGDELTQGKYILLPTIAEIARAAGRRTVVAGTKPIALLVDRATRTDDKSAVFYAGKTLPADLLTNPKLPVDAFPEVADARKAPNAAQDHWTTQFLIHRLWANGVPDYTVLWLSDPDYSQHGVGPGNPVARAALHDSDENLAAVFGALERAGVRDKTDVMVVSDHGFSMISRTVDLVDDLNSAGIHAARKFDAPPVADDVMVVGNGGSVCLYVVGHGKQTIARIVELLQKSDSAGVLFTHDPMPGTFTLAQGLIDTAAAPDIIVAMRWTDDLGHGGLHGQIVSDRQKLGAGQGNHTSLSRFDMHNTLVAIGPDFKAGFTDELPSGNADVAPTILRLLHLESPKSMDGRVLSEALTGDLAKAGASGSAADDQPRREVLKTTRALPSGTWAQYLQITHMGTREYLDEGNGKFEASTPADH